MVKDGNKPDTQQALEPFKLSESGTLGLLQKSGHVYEQVRDSLVWPNSLETFKKMSYDPIISAANSVIDLMIDRVDWYFYVPDSASDTAKKACDFLNFCMNNMEYGTWQSFISEVGSYRTYGFHIAEKVYTRVVDGDFKGKYKWQKLPTRSQCSLMRWIFSQDGRTLLGVRQSTSTAQRPVTIDGDTKGYIDIPRSKFIHFVYNTTRENPEGRSPLLGAYIPWKYKTLIEEYEAVGVAKDMGGVPMIGVDVDFLAKANADPSSSEAAVIEQLKRDAANLHAGDKAYIILPIAYHESGKPLFDFSLKGVEGGGKQYNTDDIIRRKQNEILMLYLADVLKLGTESHGSFALADSKNALLSYAIDRHLKFMARTITKDLVSQTLSLNGFNLTPEEYPQLRYSELDATDADVFSKLIQRVASVGYLPRTPELVNEILDTAGFDYRVEESIGKEEFDKLFPSDMQSRAGDGMKTPGDGTSKTKSGGDSSIKNKENA